MWHASLSFQYLSWRHYSFWKTHRSTRIHIYAETYVFTYHLHTYTHFKHFVSEGVFFLHKYYGFRFSSLTAEVLMVIGQIVCQTLDKIGKSRTVAMDILEARARVWHASFRH